MLKDAAILALYQTSNEYATLIYYIIIYKRILAVHLFILYRVTTDEIDNLKNL